MQRYVALCNIMQLDFNGIWPLSIRFLSPGYLLYSLNLVCLFTIGITQRDGSIFDYVFEIAPRSGFTGFPFNEFSNPKFWYLSIFSFHLSTFFLHPFSLLLFWLYILLECLLHNTTYSYQNVIALYLEAACLLTC